MKTFLKVLKKELHLFFSNKRLVLSTILPSIFIIFLYMLIAKYTSEDTTEHLYKVVTNIDYEYNQYLTKNINNIQIEINESLEDSLKKLEDKDIDLVIYYDTDFDNKLENNNLPNVDLYYNSLSTTSSNIYIVFNNYLESINSERTYYFSINNNKNPNIATEIDMQIELMGVLLPYILIIIIFQGCINGCATVIAGEKERGTIATLLVTPVDRKILCLGKIVSLCIISLFSSLVSLAVSIVSLKTSSQLKNIIDLSVYNTNTLFYVLLLTILSAIFFTIIISMISTYAKSVKEANLLSTPLTVLIMALAVTSISGYKVVPSSYYFLPMYNLILGFEDIFNQTFNILNFGIIGLSTLLYSTILLFIIVRMFNSEKIMFNR